ncbi:MAG: hypothetical protein R2751_04950 [Bacteroidales bacterium]
MPCVQQLHRQKQGEKQLDVEKQHNGDEGEGKEFFLPVAQENLWDQEFVEGIDRGHGHRQIDERGKGRVGVYLAVAFVVKEKKEPCASPKKNMKGYSDYFMARKVHLFQRSV